MNTARSASSGARPPAMTASASALRCRCAAGSSSCGGTWTSGGVWIHASTPSSKIGATSAPPPRCRVPPSSGRGVCASVAVNTATSSRDRNLMDGTKSALQTAQLQMSGLDRCATRPCSVRPVRAAAARSTLETHQLPTERKCPAVSTRSPRAERPCRLTRPPDQRGRLTRGVCDGHRFVRSNRPKCSRRPLAS
jgi:hypothetical protein